MKRYSKNDEEKRRRGLALKANIEDEDDDSESHEEGNEDEEIALLTRKYQKILKARKDLRRRRDNIRKIKIRND